MTTVGKEAFCVNIRWFIRRDMPEVVAIEKQGFEFPWSEEDFLRCLRLRHTIGMVAEPPPTSVRRPNPILRAARTCHSNTGPTYCIAKLRSPFVR